jgi:ATP-dependent helicase HrpB
MTDTALPIETALPELRAALAAGNAVLEAPPGAGKTTRVPLDLLEAPWLAGRKLMMLEPRRLATRAAARRMASVRGEEVGGTVGYRMRLDSRISRATRIEVVTEGVFTRLIQADPALEGIGAVLFDEFHERSLDADLGLALTLEAQRALRPDLRVLVMSATLDGAAVAALIGGARVTSAGRSFPIDTRHIPRRAGTRLEDDVAAAVRRALAADPGDVLVFLPGAPEIRRVARQLDGLPREVALHTLYGDLPQAEQDRALAPAPPGTRKVVLSTAIAETSLTIEGVTIVIDAGQMRVPRFDPRSGMTSLVTQRVTRAAADQRRGRAGRTAPGVCWRLWAAEEDRALVPHTTPEILAADLAPLALELALWGTAPADLAWLDPPPAAALAAARELLGELAALDDAGRITAHGREIAGVLHPRLAHMIVKGRAMGPMHEWGALACDLAALIGERDVLRAPSFGRGRSTDLRLRLDVIAGAERAAEADRGALARVRDAAKQYRRRFRCGDAVADPRRAGVLVALAYPDRIAQRRLGSGGGERGAFKLANGRGARLEPADPLAGADYLAVSDLGGSEQDARIFIAETLTLADIETAFAEAIATVDVVRWDAREEAVIARRERRLFALVLGEEPASPDRENVRAAMLDGVRAMGLASLPWTPALETLRARVAFLRAHEADWPDLSDAALLATLDDWLGPFLDGITRRAHLARVDLAAALGVLLPHALRQRLDAAAPTHVAVPSGSRIAIDYGGAEPVLAARLQEMFGLGESPRIANGKVPLLIHLLSPAGRPVQVTRDLASFWRSGYREVRAELRARYPRHYWPEDPLVAVATRRVRPR